LQRLGVHFEQRPEQEGHDGEIQEAQGAPGRTPATTQVGRIASQRA
jgi:hypothetical protein